MQFLGIHHGDLERHLSLLEALHTMMSRMQANPSHFGGKNWVAIIDLRGVVQELQNHLNLVEIGSEIFNHQHSYTAVIYLCFQFKERILASPTLYTPKWILGSLNLWLYCLLSLSTLRCII